MSATTFMEAREEMRTWEDWKVFMWAEKMDKTEETERRTWSSMTKDKVAAASVEWKERQERSRQERKEKRMSKS